MRQGQKVKKGLLLWVILTSAFLMVACSQKQGDEENHQTKVNKEASEIGFAEKEGLGELEQVLESCAAGMLENVEKPSYGSVCGEWMAFGLARWEGEAAGKWLDDYYEQLVSYVESCDGILHEKKYTEYSRVILALTAIGKNPADVSGYNLLIPLADFDQTVFQGINGAIYALLALDSGNYEIPDNTAESTQATRKLYVDYIMSKEISGGGWSLMGGEADIDITAMALQALAKYRDDEEVAAAVERALNVLSSQQNENGRYTAYGAESSETVSQVIVALTELGVDIEDERFVKAGKSLLSGLMEYRTEDGTFKHTMDGKGDSMATEQAFYALVSLYRVGQGKTSLYTK